MAQTPSPSAAALAPSAEPIPLAPHLRRRAESGAGVEWARDFLQATLDSLGSAVAVLDEQGRIMVTNEGWDRCAAHNGRPYAVGADFLAACDAATDSRASAQAAAAVREILSGRLQRYETPFDAPLLGAGGEERWYLLRAARHSAPGPTRVVVQLDDITDRRRAECEARLGARLLDEVDAAVIATDWDGRVTHWSRGAERLYGRPAAETIGELITELWIDAADRELTATMLAAVRERGRWEGRFEALRSDGSSVAARLHVVALHGDDGAPQGSVGVAVDARESDRIEQELRTARNFSSAVTDSMAEGLCAVDEQGRLVYMNTAAEEMLGWRQSEVFGQVMHNVIHGRRPDGAGLPVDQCPIIRSRVDGEVVRVDDDAFVRRDGTMLPVSYTASPFETAEGIRGSVFVFCDNTEARAQRERIERELETLSWIPRIRDALEEDRFVLHAQPIIDLASGDTVQHELLIRMHDPKGKLVPPGLFLPTAEEHGLIGDIDRWVIRESARLAGRGHAVELNLSAESLGDPGLFDVVDAELRRAGADPSLVVFELTETALLRSEQTAQSFIDRVDRLGCRLALDDFGTGYGGFTYLKRFPVHYLKIDLEFVRDLPRDPASQNVVRAVVRLAQDFGQKTVAEGVEDEETLHLLREYGVDYAQGYWIGRPAPLAERLGVER
jgi:PAS domain S-box-containing protein